jgi:hypothetical protein
LAGSIARDGFEAGSKWIAAAGLTQQELTNWPKNDPATKEAAAAFAKEHGIK